MFGISKQTYRRGDWGTRDNDEEVDNELVRECKTVTCADCKKRVEYDDAHKPN